MDFNLTEFLIKLAENNALLSILFAFFYFGVKKMVAMQDKSNREILKLEKEKREAEAETLRKETEIRVLKRDKQIEDLRNESKEARRDLDMRISTIEKDHSIFETKLSKNLDKLYTKLEQICEDITILKTERKMGS